MRFLNGLALGALAAALNTPTAQAAKPEVLVKSSSHMLLGQPGGAKLTIKVDTPYSQVQREIKRNFLTLLQSLPRVARSQVFTEEKLTPTSQSNDEQTIAGAHTLLMRFADSQLMPESLFTLNEERLECKAKTDCDAHVELSLQGPVKSYAEKIEARPIQNLNGSFTLTTGAEPIDAKDVTKGTTIFLSLRFHDVRYLHFLAGLVEKKQLKTLPTVDELNTGFLIWAKSAAPRLAAGGGQ
ncbi:MAG: hypothetical protein AB7P04_12295 [Bacteriovoracia bacterium]